MSAGRGQQYGVVSAHNGIDVTAVLQLSDETSLFVPLHMNIYGRGKASLRTLWVRRITETIVAQLRRTETDRQTEK